MPIYIDEAGRGPLAGPVRVGLVYIQNPTQIPFETEKFADSKLLSKKKRDSAYVFLTQLKQQKNLFRTSASSSAKIINQDGIVSAIRQAILKGLKKLEKKFGKQIYQEKIFLDGNTSFGLKKYIPNEIETIIKGDQKIVFISMASIIAKVERDEFMIKISQKYPEYGFEKHKGYGTKFHREMILKYGPCEIHRDLYLRKILSQPKLAENLFE